MKPTRASLLVSCFVFLFSDNLLSEELRLNATRDTWLSAVGDEAKGANGGAPRLKLKSIQELSLIDFDFAQLKDKDLIRCRLFLKQASDVPIDRITLTTMGASWVEGNATNYAIVDGQSTFSHQSYPQRRWAGSDLTAVSLGAGSTLWYSLQPDRLAEDWYAYEVPVELVQSCVAGLSSGWLIMDDTGSTWKRDGEKFEHQLFPNRFAYSRDSNRNSMPYLEIEYRQASGADKVAAPELLEWHPPKNHSAEPRPILRWRMPSSDDRNPIIGFQLSIDGQSVEQSLMPSARPTSDGWITLVVDPRFPAFDPSVSHRVELRSVDVYGHQSPPKLLETDAIPKVVDTLPIQPIEPERLGYPAVDKVDWNNCLKLDEADSNASPLITVIDPLDQLIPVVDKIIPGNRPDYLSSNALWSAKERTVSLSSCRGAWVGFQLAIKNPLPSMELRCVLPNHPGMRLEAYRYEYVNTPSGYIADPLIPIADMQSLHRGVRMETSKHSKDLGSWLIEVFVPEDTPSQAWLGSIEIHSGAAVCNIQLRVSVSPRLIPKELSFLPEMNCYDLPPNDVDYYRLGNRHRVVVNRVPYYQSGQVAVGFAPNGNLGQWDWKDWDRRFGPLLDGSAFADLPRGKLPVECFYLPMHENWPTPMDGAYNGSYWADEAFPDSYRQNWEKAVSDCVEHIESNQWYQTRFHVFLNNKVDFKKRGWSRGSSPWLLDEPANFQDYVALRYFGQAFKAAYDRSHRRSNVLFRCDISRPQWQRTTLDGLLDYNVVSQTAFREYRRLVLDRKIRGRQTVMVYGSNNPIGTNNVQSVAWAWDVWCRGGDGILPWQTIGNEQSWHKADELALFYPDPTGSNKAPIPSIRLKAYCYGQQDVELLRLHALSSTKGDRFAWGEQMLKALPLSSNSRTDERIQEDAGWADYGNITPETFEVLRRQLQR